VKYHVDTGAQRLTYNDEDEFFDAWEQGELRPDALYWHKGMKAWRPVYQHEVIADALSEVSVKGTFERAWKLTRQHIGHLSLLTLASLLLVGLGSIPLIWWAVKVAESADRTVHAMVAGNSEGVVDLDLPDYSVGWRIGHMGAEQGQFLYELVRADEPVENWSEMINISFAASGTNVDEAAENFKAALQGTDASAEIKGDDVLDDKSRMVTYASSVEEGIMRFMLGTDGLHMVAYMVKPEARSDEGWSAGRAVVLGARMSNMEDSKPAGGLSPDEGTKMTLPVLQVESSAEQGLMLKQHPLLRGELNTILPWPVIAILYLVMMMSFKILVDCILYYLARCASMEIVMGQWSEVLKGLSAWKGLVKYNIWNFLLLGITLLLPLLLVVLLTSLLGPLGGLFGMLVGIIPFAYLAMSTYYGPLVVIDRSSKTFGGKVNAWRAFWDTRRRLSSYWLILLVVLIICSIAGAIINGLVMLALTFLGSLIPLAIIVVPFVAILVGPLIQMVIMLAMAVNYRAIFPDENPDLMLTS
jgi:hypothetical protein